MQVGFEKRMDECWMGWCILASVCIVVEVRCLGWTNILKVLFIWPVWNIFCLNRFTCVLHTHTLAKECHHLAPAEHMNPKWSEQKKVWKKSYSFKENKFIWWLAFMGSVFSAFDYVQLVNATHINGEIDERIYELPCALCHSVTICNQINKWTTIEAITKRQLKLVVRGCMRTDYGGVACVRQANSRPSENGLENNNKWMRVEQRPTRPN